MERQDFDMPFLLQYENVAWYKDGIVNILDRRIYPTKIKYVECKSYIEVAQAIKNMVTQSTGPYTAVAMGMALAAYECRNKTKSEQMFFLEKASSVLSNSRPTAANRYKVITEYCLANAKEAIKEDKDPVKVIQNCAINSLNKRYSTMQKVGDYLCDLIPDNGCILTQCYGETIIGTLIRSAKKNNKNFRVICAETRPYFQGARLTSSCFASMGFDTTVISDNMVAYAIQNENISLFTSAADTITKDGHVANKVGTLQIAILSKHFKIPYYVTGIPDADKTNKKDIIIEMRNPEEVLEARGIRNCLHEVKGLYPAFDITPPELISGVVTDKGTYKPKDLNNYFDTDSNYFY